MSELHPDLALVASDHGVFLRRDAVAAGYDDNAIARELRSGRWRRVRHGA
ncbi:type IV toxin-antitoxin system AbiEi family antitoxin domain-containing protein [Nocardioides sp. CPCC 205120]